MINVLTALIEVVDKILSSYLGIKFKQGFSGEFTGNESSFFEFWYDNFKSDIIRRINLLVFEYFVQAEPVMFVVCK